MGLDWEQIMQDSLAIFIKMASDILVDTWPIWASIIGAAIASFIVNRTLRSGFIFAGYPRHQAKKKADKISGILDLISTASDLNKKK
ncbi:hypothetical protein ACS3UN_06985 [Oscillospiraceae bacterium LTW-04]|nr:hypothetical protein RBH76_03375 [Oscillospiraceae bacterium MB24-C1]